MTAGAPTPWPRLRDSWWVFGLAVVALGLFSAGLLFSLRCGGQRCRASLPDRLFDLDAVGGLPRLFTTGLFVAVLVLAWRASRSADGGARRWWAAIALVGAGLALAKLTSLHALLKTDTSPALTLFGGLTGTAVGLGALWVAGRRWGVAATRPVVLALALYAAAALGLDVVTGVAAAVQNTVGSLTVAGATFVEEFGEALTALVLVVVVRWQSAAPTERDSGPPAGPDPHSSSVR